MSMRLFYQLFLISTIITLCRGRKFVIGGVETSEISQLTTALEVGGEHRYPCYVSVVVYDTPDLKNVIKGATVTVLTKSRTDDSKYYGYSVATTNDFGQACILTLCRKEALIYVEAGSTNERLFVVNKTNQALPTGYTYETLQNEQYVRFNVRNWGIVFNKSGPVYNLNEKSRCENAKTAHNHFSFSFLAIKEELIDADVDTHMKNMSWYYPYPMTDTYQVCFMKIKVLTPLYQAKVTLESIEPISKQLFGTYTAGPKAAPSSTEQSKKAACVEFRCAARDNTLGYEVVMNTTVIGWVSGSSLQNCKIE
ncbi:Cartilage intermediate layer protein 2 [Mactra antiquata]